jgi:hypothetical protein
MIKKIFIGLLLFCFATERVAAQQKSNKLANQLKFTTITQLSYLAGSASSGGAFQLINGVAYKQLYVGAGVALDYYQYRGFPVFADVRYHFSQKRNSLFLYADGGVHIPWHNKNINQPESKLKSGLYTDVGFGYKLNQKNGNALVISFGHSHKKVKEERLETIWWIPIRDANIPQQTVKYEYGFNRLAIKFGLLF